MFILQIVNKLCNFFAYPTFPYQRPIPPTKKSDPCDYFFCQTIVKMSIAALKGNTNHWPNHIAGECLAVMFGRLEISIFSSRLHLWDVILSKKHNHQFCVGETVPRLKKPRPPGLLESLGQFKYILSQGCWIEYLT